MSATAKLATYAVVLVAALGAGATVGAVAGPIDVGGTGDHGTDQHGTGPAGTGAASAVSLPAAGLQVAQAGYAFVPEDRVADPGPFEFQITGPDGMPVEEFDELHERELHFILASRDLGQFAHLHPTRHGGRWTVDLPRLPAGAYRAFADFQPADHDQLTLGVDLQVPGTVEVTDPLEPVATDHVDGFDVSLDRAADGDEVTVTVRRNGELVTTQPYLGAAGHLVALRDGDLAYLHVHPLDDEPGGPTRFAVEVPSPGTYALFFDFRVDDVVRTAHFVIDTTDPSPASEGDAEHGDH